MCQASELAHDSYQFTQTQYRREERDHQQILQNTVVVKAVRLVLASCLTVEEDTPFTRYYVPRDQRMRVDGGSAEPIRVEEEESHRSEPEARREEQVAGKESVFEEQGRSSLYQPDENSQDQGKEENEGLILEEDDQDQKKEGEVEQEQEEQGFPKNEVVFCRV